MVHSEGMTMKQKKAISDAVIERLPLYYRDLLLLQDAGIDIISSEKLGERLGITPEQIRKDLTCFGAFGKKGVGYYVSIVLDDKRLCQQSLSTNSKNLPIDLQIYEMFL